MSSRLLLVGLAAGLFLSPSAVHADVLGDTQTFLVNESYDREGAQSINSTLRAVGTHAYYYVDDRYWSSLNSSEQSGYLAALQTLAADFDTTIYPKERAFWGTEDSPGVDGDPRITVVLERLVEGNGGYFETVNSYPRSVAPESNEREMIFVSARSVWNQNARNFLAHEFQHLISFYQREIIRGIRDDIWINEGRSEYSITIADYNSPYEGSTLQRRAQSFVRSPSDSLIEWPNSSTDYAIAALFTHYLAGHFGDELLQHTIQSRQVGVAAINEWFSQRGRSDRFGNVFIDWATASLLNDQSLGMQYGYVTEGLNTIHVLPQETLFLQENGTTTATITLKEWQPMWMALRVPAFGALSDAVSLTLTNPSAGTNANFWGGTAVAQYEGGVQKVTEWQASDSTTYASIPTDFNGRRLSEVVLVFAFGDSAPLNNRNVLSSTATITAVLGAGEVTSTPEPTGDLQDGDLIRRPGQEEVYVIWGPYRRYLPEGVLELYGFQDRPVVAVADDVFFGYRSSNYIRIEGQEKVWAVWPDGTKHWLNITPSQWDASGRDWGAIFIVNDREGNFYTTGSDITR